MSGSADRSRTPLVRSRYEEESRTERYGSRTDDDEESQLGGSAVEDHHGHDDAMCGVWGRGEEDPTREDVRDDVDYDDAETPGGFRGMPEESPERRTRPSSVRLSTGREEERHPLLPEETDAVGAWCLKVGA